LRRRRISFSTFTSKPSPFGFREGFLLSLIQPLDLFVDVLEALDKRANAIA
jgi:hypothetical protein